ncbi:MAG TPA: preprotein translocase subunit YajC [Clostridia bacterium]|jgi:preprotein translocase subunit YajC|nr:preprotein translocase subunit YajC [Clostridia bacterium]HPY43038.1 preprotein translocase subunit YajC [Clostridia bacterium]HQA96548.1 preprotein translocase subunit YajC [Clostridia bacterium]HQO55687.1 preprotein translocase subunit YajC [Clostridia bacterium]
MFDWLFKIPSALAEAAAPAADAGAATADPSSPASLISMFLPMVLIIGVFYFLMIRPQRKKDKKIKEMLANLKAGDRIVTIGGIYGTIKGLRDDSVILTIGHQNTEMIVARWAIRNVEEITVENEGELLT